MKVVRWSALTAQMPSLTVSTIQRYSSSPAGRWPFARPWPMARAARPAAARQTRRLTSPGRSAAARSANKAPRTSPPPRGSKRIGTTQHDRGAPASPSHGSQPSPAGPRRSSIMRTSPSTVTPGITGPAGLQSSIDATDRAASRSAAPAPGPHSQPAGPPPESRCRTPHATPARSASTIPQMAARTSPASLAEPIIPRIGPSASSIASAQLPISRADDPPPAAGSLPPAPAPSPRSDQAAGRPSSAARSRSTGPLGRGFP